MALDVTTLCEQYNTDKCRGEFPHSKIYDKLFKEYRREPIRLLEIGVNRGRSIPVWERYFPFAELYAIDIKLECLEYSSNRTEVIILDQSNKSDMVEFSRNYGPFDIVIDDGSHMTSHQILTFETLWPWVLSGGLYVVEDTLTSYDSKYVDSEKTCVEYFKDRIDDVHLPIANRPILFENIGVIIIKQDLIAVLKV